jgi:adenosylcobinamide-phosphate synthase
VPLSPLVARPLGLAAGIIADRLWADPRRYHPVAGFGQLAAAAERRCYADDVARGGWYTAGCVGLPVVVGAVVERALAGRPLLQAAAVGLATWAVLGGTSLLREGQIMATLLEEDDIAAAQARLSHLCARDPAGMDAGHLARATIESMAENTSDAVVAPLFWGAVAGLPGLLGYRAANTLDAMIGYTSAEYLHFGRAAARLDDVLNLVPARVTGVVTALVAPLVGGSTSEAARVLRRDGGRHPSPNAGRPESAAAGALGVRLGGENAYSGRLERRPSLGDGRAPEVADVRRAVRLSTAVAAVGGLLSVAMAAATSAVNRRRRSGARSGPARPAVTS